MIHSMYFAHMFENHRQFWGGPSVNDFEHLKTLLENTKDYFVWIYIPTQQGVFNRMMEKYDLKQYISFEQKDYITNPNYPDQGPRLKLVIMKGKGKYHAN